jgi:hypothetical protein
VAKAADFLYFFVIASVPTPYENILFNSWHGFKSCERVVSLLVCKPDSQFKSHFLSSSWKAEKTSVPSAAAIPYYDPPNTT